MATIKYHRVTSADIHNAARCVCHHERKLIRLERGDFDDVFVDVDKEKKTTRIRLERSKAELHKLERIFNRQIRA